MNNPADDAGTKAPDTGKREPGAPGESPSVADFEMIRWSLSLSIDERLAVLQDFVDTFWTPQHG
jgi:hypothetical protein